MLVLSRKLNEAIIIDGGIRVIVVGIRNNQIRLGFEYREFCLSCHGIDGKGTEMRPNMPTIPDFTVGEWQDSKNRTALALSILDAKGTLMPAFRARVSEEDAQNLVAYIRAFGPRQTRQVESIAPAAPASDFENQFRQLQRQWDELEKQLRELSPPRAVP